MEHEHLNETTYALGGYDNKQTFIMNDFSYCWNALSKHIFRN